MRRVATELDVGTMSLHRYVPGKAELLDLMLDKVVTLDADARPDPDADWRPALEAAARESWQPHQEHPRLRRLRHRHRPHPAQLRTRRKAHRHQQ
ncbi:hypothetical protein [Streptomyces halobius]|nr:hypothetical protein [Streptomyces halobius]